MRPTVLIESNNDWNDYWYQRQEFATRFARAGCRVIFLNKTFKRWPKFRSLVAGTYRSPQRGFVSNPIPAGIHVLTPFWLPPLRIFRPMNRRLIRKTFSSSPLPPSPLFITYAPSFNTLDLISLIRPSKTIYVNVHNYDRAHVISDVLAAENELIGLADYLLADSEFNRQRIMRKQRQPKHKQVFLSPPGVDLTAFSGTFRGNEARSATRLLYYGGIGPHLDVDLYNQLAKCYQVRFIGKVSSGFRSELSEKIEILPPVPMSELGPYIREADILTIFYRENEYTHAVIPAKFFECLASAKPVLISGVKQIGAFSHLVYDVGGSLATAQQAIARLPQEESQQKVSERQAVAAIASWERRFADFSSTIRFGID